MLSSKGVDCVGCSEKSEFVQKAFESQSLPPKEKEEAPEVIDEEVKEKGKVDKLKKEELEDVRAF